MSGADSLVANAALLTEAALPRLLLPVAGIVSTMFDFVITFAILVVFALYFGYYPTWRYVFIPMVLLVGFTLTFGLSLLLCAINVQYRDIRNLLPMFVQLLLRGSPVVYSLNTLGGSWPQVLACLNPLVGIVQGFRWAVVETGPPSHLAILSSLTYTVVLLVVGFIYLGTAG